MQGLFGPAERDMLERLLKREKRLWKVALPQGVGVFPLTVAVFKISLGRYREVRLPAVLVLPYRRFYTAHTYAYKEVALGGSSYLCITGYFGLFRPFQTALLVFLPGTAGAWLIDTDFNLFGGNLSLIHLMSVLAVPFITLVFRTY